MWIPAERKTDVWCLAVVALGAMTGLISVEPSFGQSGRGPVPPVIRSVRAEIGKDGATIVVVEASAALPEPSAGVAATPPPRIYFDFTDVLADPNLQPIAPTATVKAVRVAEHSATPLVTRVVIDLVRATTYRVDSSARSQGRIAVVLGAPSSERVAASPPPTPPGKSAPPTATSSSKAPLAPPPPFGASQSSPRASTPTPSGAASANQSSQSKAPSAAARGRSDAAGNQYGVRIASALVRLHVLRPLLEAIDRRADSIPGDLNAAASEFDAIGKLLSGIKPPSTRESTHELLLRTCTLGARAVRMRQEASASKDVGKSWEAASAAAGAMMMFDKANTDLTK